MCARMHARTYAQTQLAATKQSLSQANDRIRAGQDAASSATTQLSSVQVDHGHRVAQLEEALASARKEARVKEQLYQAALAGKRSLEAQSGKVAADAVAQLDELRVRGIGGMAWHGIGSMAWHGMALVAWHGMAWHGMAWHGMAWHDMALVAWPAWHW